MVTKSETAFQNELRKDIESMFPGCIVMRSDPTKIQGIPDLIVLYMDKWAALECKKSKGAKHQPNQDYYVDMMSTMSYASFVYPENKEEVLHELQRAFESDRETRISQP